MIRQEKVPTEAASRSLHEAVPWTETGPDRSSWHGKRCGMLDLKVKGYEDPRFLI